MNRMRETKDFNQELLMMIEKWLRMFVFHMMKSKRN